MEEVFDHIKMGKELRHFVYPPRISDDILCFTDGLKEIIPLKLTELLDRARILKEQRDFELRLVTATTKRGSLEEYFWSSLAFHQFSEYFVVKKWINYWLRLWYKVSSKSLVPIKNTPSGWVSEDEIEKAEEVPLQDLYDGQLRQLGSRLVGLCPLHQEKTPSFNIYAQTNSFYCFGCNSSGNPITFVQKTKNLNFPEAVRYLL